MPIEAPRIAPEILQVIVQPGGTAEDVEHDVDVIDGDPRFALVAGSVVTFEGIFFRQLVDLVADSAHLTGTGACGDDVKIGDGRNAGHVEHDDIVAACYGGKAGGFNGKSP